MTRDIASELCISGSVRYAPRRTLTSRASFNLLLWQEGQPGCQAGHSWKRRGAPPWYFAAAIGPYCTILSLHPTSHSHIPGLCWKASRSGVWPNPTLCLFSYIRIDWHIAMPPPLHIIYNYSSRIDWVVVTEILWSTKPKNKLLSGPWQGLLTPALCTYSLASGQSCQPMEDSCHPPWISHVDGRCLHFPSRYLSPGINCSESSGCPSFS